MSRLHPADWPNVGAPVPPPAHDPTLLTIKMELERKVTAEMVRIHEMHQHSKLTTREAVLSLTSLWNASAGLVDMSTMDAMTSMFRVAGPMGSPPTATVAQTADQTLVSWVEGERMRVLRVPGAPKDVPYPNEDLALAAHKAFIQKLAGQYGAAIHT